MGSIKKFIKIKTEEIFKDLDDAIHIYKSNRPMLFATSIFDDKLKKYRTISQILVSRFIKNPKISVKKINKNSGTYLFAKIGKTKYRLGLWPNDYVPDNLIFKKSKFNHYYIYIKIPKYFIGAKYKNKNIRSIILLPALIKVDKTFSRQLGIFASDGFKSNALGIRNTELFLVKELIKLFKGFNISEKRLQITEKKYKKYKKQYSFYLCSKILIVFINKLHTTLLRMLLENPEKNKELIAGYIQGFHAGDGCCSKRSIQIVSYKEDPALDFIKKISKKLDLNIGYVNKNENYEILEFLGLPTYLKFYKYYIWSPNKLKKAIFYLKKRNPFILFNKKFLKRLSYRNIQDLQRIFKVDIRTVYRYLNGESFIPFRRMLIFCEKEKIDPSSLTKEIQRIKTSNGSYENILAKEIYRDFLKINGD